MALFSNPSRKVLALQGGGAHGAFTWGALDRLLEDGFKFSAITGVSSGAMIAAMAVQGLVQNGPAGARKAMGELWERVAAGNIFGPVNSSLDWLWGWDKTRELGNEIAWQGVTNALRMFSPGQLNPFGQNPLEPLLHDLLDIDAIRHPSAPKLFVAATDVESGQAKIFDNAEISVPVLLASSCIPMMFPAVNIAGRHYWDGGYSCNPALTPVLALKPDTLVLIRAQPRIRKGVPNTTADIVHRLHEIAFQAPLDAELNDLPKHVRLHDISADAALAAHPLISKMNTDRDFLNRLFAAGRDAATLPVTV
ncbi:MAG: patatin [Acidocella sp. 20-57-95]|nr:MAG: patatin [Acidocella sp. 20-57-95]HQT63610.1 patatin-like phospholipase family protein [Acidocella sp.]